MRFPKKLSIVIPVYNEERRIGHAIKICLKHQEKYPDWQFIFVNDGSTDETLKALRQTSFKIVSYSQNQGKGYALKQGVKIATKPIILLTDVDFSTPLSEISLFYPFIQKGADLVIGSRKVIGANVLKHQSKLREWLGRQFTNMAKIWLGLSVSDVTCGFKLFKSKAGKKLFKKSNINGWGYDAEILFLAKKNNLKVVDVAVTWKNDDRTKVSIFRDIFRSIADLIKIRWFYLTKRY